MDKSFKGRITVELIGEESGVVYHRTVSEDLTMDVAEVAVYLSQVPQAILTAQLAANAQMFKA